MTLAVVVAVGCFVEVIVLDSREHESFELYNLPISFAKKRWIHTERQAKILPKKDSIAVLNIHVSKTPPSLAEPLWPL